METLTWALAVIVLLYTVFRWRTLPRVLPIHYDMYGVADDWGGRWTVFLVPVVLALCCGIVSVCERLGLKHINLPFRVNMERELYVLRAVRDVLSTLNLELAVLFAVLQFCTINGYNLPTWFIWFMTGGILATSGFGVWRSWKCNQGTL